MKQHAADLCMDEQSGHLGAQRKGATFEISDDHIAVTAWSTFGSSGRFTITDGREQAIAQVANSRANIRVMP